MDAQERKKMLMRSILEESQGRRLKNNAEEGKSKKVKGKRENAGAEKHDSLLIHTRLQPGDKKPIKIPFNRFNGFLTISAYRNR
ncbi:MAG TPA: hypothetical protein VKB86_10790 [Pyrinomonadaceae bacterium]|nr:hypothetical protein [Pyrinomonadaceae bacterium]